MTALYNVYSDLKRYVTTYNICIACAAQWVMDHVHTMHAYADID